MKRLPLAVAYTIAAIGCGRNSPTADVAVATIDRSSALALFERRIVPILESPNPSSCSECHLAAVDLKEYIHRDQAKTFASLLAAGLIDVDHPDDSKLLALIARKPEKPTLVGDAARQEELAAFREWIRAAAADETLLATSPTADKAGPQAPLEVVRHARADGVLASFVDSLWSEIGRCAGCHSPDRNQKQVAEHGEYVSWIAPNDPQGTLDNIVAAKLIDLERPDQSKLLLKPTMQIEHGGGQKMAIGDRSYKQFHRFLADYAAVINGQYDDVADLPVPSAQTAIVSDIWLRFEGIPESLDKKVLQAAIYAADPAAAGGWSADPVAVADRPIFGQGQAWQQHLTLLAPKDSARAKEMLAARSLAKSKYLIKVYVDVEDKLRQQYPYELGQQEFVGETTLETDWPSGYGAMTKLPYPVPTP